MNRKERNTRLMTNFKEIGSPPRVWGRLFVIIG